MSSGTGLDTAADLEAIRARIDQWRRTRTKRAAMPEDLWLAATALGQRLGVHPVSQRLRLNYDRLKLRVAESELRQERAENMDVLVGVDGGQELSHLVA